MRIRFRQRGEWCVGDVGFSEGDTRVTVSAKGRSRTEALARAAAMAERLAPPQVRVAVKAAKGIAAASMLGRGLLRRLGRKLRRRRPAAAKLAAALDLDHVKGVAPRVRVRRRPAEAVEPEQAVEPEAVEPEAVEPEPEAVEPEPEAVEPESEAR